MVGILAAILAAVVALGALVADTARILSSVQALGVAVGAEIVLILFLARYSFKARLVALGVFLLSFASGSLLLPFAGAPAEVVWGVLALAYLGPLALLGILLPSLVRWTARHVRKRGRH